MPALAARRYSSLALSLVLSARRIFPTALNQPTHYCRMPYCGRLVALWVEAGTGPFTFAGHIDNVFRVLPRPVFQFFPSSPPPLPPCRISQRRRAYRKDSTAGSCRLRSRMMMHARLLTESFMMAGPLVAGKHLVFCALGRSMESLSVRIAPMVFAGELGGCCWNFLIRRVRRGKTETNGKGWNQIERNSIEWQARWGSYCRLNLCMRAAPPGCPPAQDLTRAPGSRS